MNRRKFLGISGTLILGEAISWPKDKNKRVKHVDELIYKGTITLPDEVIHHALSSKLYRTISRHSVIRFKLHGILFLFRELAPTTNYVGEIVKTSVGGIRVHLFKVIDVDNTKYVFDFNNFDTTKINEKTI
jgi:hypothetical protein